jgi:hypothetical protein
LEERVREAAEVHLAWRYTGLALLFVGLLLATAGDSSESVERLGDTLQSGCHVVGHQAAP